MFSLAFLSKNVLSLSSLCLLSVSRTNKKDTGERYSHQPLGMFWLWWSDYRKKILLARKSDYIKVFSTLVKKVLN